MTWLKVGKLLQEHSSASPLLRENSTTSKKGHEHSRHVASAESRNADSLHLPGNKAESVAICVDLWPTRAFDRAAVGKDGLRLELNLPVVGGFVLFSAALQFSGTILRFLITPSGHSLPLSL